MSDKNVIKTQVRFSADIWNYITEESKRLNIAKNAVLIKIIDEYRKGHSSKTEP